MKMFKEAGYEAEFFKKLTDNADFAQEREIINTGLKRPLWWSVKNVRKGEPSLNTSIIKCTSCRQSPRVQKACFAMLLKAIKKARRSKKTEKFICLNNFNGFCMPVVQGGNVYGFIGLCHISEQLPGQSIALLENFINIVAKDIQKELELSKLYETIRPRAIALSTVHTIHRLISSTLDLDELLPRIARLSIQVMQANRCSVKLLDPERNILVPVTTIDIRTKRKLNPKELRVGKGVPGKAVKAMRILKGRDFLSVPLIDEEVMGVITIYDKVNHNAFTQFDQEILMTIAEQAVIAIKNAQLYREQESLAINSVKSLATILDTRGPSAFIPRTAFVRIVLEIGKELHFSQLDLRCLRCAALLHDAGQIFVPDEILSKPSKLTGEEYDLVKEHPAHGAKIFEPTKYLKPVIPIILHHHENYDGSGYPNSLKGEQIPMGARIMAVVSAFLAMTTPRSYRVTKTITEAREEITRNSGSQFDPKVVSIFQKVIDRKEVLAIVEGEYASELAQVPTGSDIF
ncbi:MAG: HD domain-containing phosphohydrolase [Candidatus Omnitrophota bacterium]